MDACGFPIIAPDTWTDVLVQEPVFRVKDTFSVDVEEEVAVSRCISNKSNEFIMQDCICFFYLPLNSKSRF